MISLKNTITDIVTKHINKWDPMGLLAHGAPDDEYESEIEEIVDVLLDSKDEIEVALDIKSVFDRMFGNKINFDECLVIAKQIWKDSFE